MNTIDNLVSYYGVFDGITKWQQPLNYSVDFYGIGKKEFILKNFPLYKTSHEERTTGCGPMSYGGPKGEMSFFYKPYDKIVLKWYTVEPEDYKKYKLKPQEPEYDYNKVIKRKPVEYIVNVKLPKVFKKRNGYAINFYIDSDNNKAYVSYVIEINEDEYKEIDSAGKPFNIEKVIGRQLPKNKRGFYPFRKRKKNSGVWHSK